MPTGRDKVPGSADFLSSYPDVVSRGPDGMSGAGDEMPARGYAVPDAGNPVPCGTNAVSTGNYPMSDDQHVVSVRLYAVPSGQDEMPDLHHSAGRGRRRAGTRDTVPDCGDALPERQPVSCDGEGDTVGSRPWAMARLGRR